MNLNGFADLLLPMAEKYNADEHVATMLKAILNQLMNQTEQCIS